MQTHRISENHRRFSHFHGSKQGIHTPHAMPSIAIIIPSETDLVSRQDSCLFIAEERKKDRVSTVEAVNVSVVLEELADQLDVLGRSMGPEIELRTRRSVETDRHLNRPAFRFNKKASHSFTNKSKMTMNLLSKSEESEGPSIDGSVYEEEEMEEEVEEGEPEPVYLLKQNYESKIPRRIRQTVYGAGTALTKRLSKAIRESYLNTLTEAGKTQVDRGFLQVAIQDLTLDLLQNASCSTIVDLVDSERTNAEATVERIIKAMKDEKSIRQGRTRIRRVRQEKKLESMALDRFIWGVEDERQELLNRKQLECDYIEATANMMRTRIKKQCKLREKDYYVTVHNLKTKQTNEYKAHSSIMDFMNSQHQDVKAKAVAWADKYETDKDLSQFFLDQMKEERERDRNRIVWLKKMIASYLEICLDHRRIKCIVESRITKTTLELKSCIYIQAWWQGTMVRNRLGRYRPVKEKKEKMGKKGKEKKGK